VIDDSAFFGDLMERSLKTIARDIREAHKDDWDTGDEESIADKYLESVKELAENLKKDDPTPPPIVENEDEKMTFVDKATVIQWGKKLDINFAKLSPEETSTLMNLVTKASRNPLIRQPSKGRGKKK
jgi:hypothetical protein